MHMQVRLGHQHGIPTGHPRTSGDIRSVSNANNSPFPLRTIARQLSSTSFGERVEGMYTLHRELSKIVGATSFQGHSDRLREAEVGLKTYSPYSKMENGEARAPYELEITIQNEVTVRVQCFADGIRVYRDGHNDEVISHDTQGLQVILHQIFEDVAARKGMKIVFDLPIRDV